MTKHGSSSNNIFKIIIIRQDFTTHTLLSFAPNFFLQVDKITKPLPIFHIEVLSPDVKSFPEFSSFLSQSLANNQADSITQIITGKSIQILVVANFNSLTRISTNLHRQMLNHKFHFILTGKILQISYSLMKVPHFHHISLNFNVFGIILSISHFSSYIIR